MIDVLEDFVSFVFFPARLICSLTLGRLLSFAILPSQRMFKSKTKLENIEINTDVLNEDHELSDKNQYIIYFCANGESGSNDNHLKEHHEYESFYCSDEDINTHLIKFDFPGVYKSPGSPNCYLNLVDSSVVVIEMLLNKGIKPEQIILHGLSLGGAISLYAYKKMLDKGITLGGVFNDRSFSTLSDAALGIIGISMYESNLISKLFYIVLKPIVKIILWLTRWEMEPYKIYKDIDEARKDFITIDNENAQDGMIHHGASMYTALSNGEDRFKKHLFYTNLYGSRCKQHMISRLDRNNIKDFHAQSNVKYIHEFQKRIHSLKK